jgi:general secretion pathway protein E
MGIEPYLISTTLSGVLAQRLVRLLCPHCKEEYRPPLRELKTMFPGRVDLDKAVFYRPKGCDNCRGTGYTGRQGIFELLTMSDEVKQRIHDGDHLHGIRKILRAQGLKSLGESGMELVFKGLTTVEEVSRVAVE